MVTYSPELANKICAAVRPSALRARPREPRLGEGPLTSPSEWLRPWRVADGTQRDGSRRT